MSQCIVRIEKLTNGFEVEVFDNEIDAANSKPKNPYKEPWKSYAFGTPKEVVSFLGKVLGKIHTPDGDEFASNFKRATTEGS